MRERNLNIKIYEKKYGIKNINVKKKKIEKKNSERINLFKKNDKINIKKLNNNRLFFSNFIF